MLTFISDERSLSHFDENMLSIRLPEDGRAHTEINITGTETMRFTSTEDCFRLSRLSDVTQPQACIEVFGDARSQIFRWRIGGRRVSQAE